MTELKPCPFCGGEADVMLSQSRWGQSYTIHHAEKGRCPAGFVASMQFATEAEAIAAWNKRADDYKQAAEYWKRMYEETFAERTCKRFWTGAEMVCSRCAHQLNNATANYCPNCGAKVVG